MDFAFCAYLNPKPETLSLNPKPLKPKPLSPEPHCFFFQILGLERVDPSLGGIVGCCWVLFQWRGHQD